MLKGNRNWLAIAGLMISQHQLLRQIKSKGNEEPFDIAGICFIPCLIQLSLTVYQKYLKYMAKYFKYAAFLLGFFQGGTAENVLGGAPSKFSRANDSGRGNIFSKKMKFSH